MFLFFFQENIPFHLNGSCIPRPPSFCTYRYLKLPCLGGRDVTGGISNVILMSRGDCTRKCLMNGKALCLGRPGISHAACDGKSFLKSRPSLSGPGGSQRMHTYQREVTISIQVCAVQPALTLTVVSCLSYTPN